MWNPRMKMMTQRTRKTIDDVNSAHSPAWESTHWATNCGSAIPRIDGKCAFNFSSKSLHFCDTYHPNICPSFARSWHTFKTVPQILTRRRLITTTTTTRDIMLSIHSGIWRYELVASDHLPPWLARPGFATDAEELLCSQIQILFFR